MKNIRKFLFIVTILIFTPNFFAEGPAASSDSETEEFLDVESDWEWILGDIKEAGNWDDKINRPTEQWINEAIKAALSEIDENDQVTVDTLVEDLQKRLDAIYVKNSDGSNKKQIFQKDLQNSHQIINSFKDILNKHINAKKEEIEKAKLNLENKDLDGFQSFLSQGKLDWWGSFDPVWKNEIIQKARVLIDSGISKDKVTQEIIKGINSYKQQVFFFQTNKIEAQKNEIIDDVNKLAAITQPVLEPGKQAEALKLLEEEQKKNAIENQLRLSSSSAAKTSKSEVLVPKQEQQLKVIDYPEESAKNLNPSMGLREEQAQERYQQQKKALLQQLKGHQVAEREKQLSILREQIAQGELALREKKDETLNAKIKKESIDKEEHQKKYKGVIEDIERKRKIKSRREELRKIIKYKKDRDQKILQQQKVLQ